MDHLTPEVDREGLGYYWKDVAEAGKKGKEISRPSSPPFSDPPRIS